LAARYGATIRPNHTVIYTPDKGAKPFFSQGELEFDVIIFNELSQQHETIVLKGLVIDSPLDLIIGLPDIRKYSLLRKCEAQILNFGMEPREEAVTSVHRPVTDTCSTSSECARPTPAPVATRPGSKPSSASDVNALRASREKATKVDGATTHCPVPQIRKDLAKCIVI